MSDSDPFKDLAEAESDQQIDQAEADTDADLDQDHSADVDLSQSMADDTNEDVSEPAFEFGDTHQHAVYVRPDAWQAFEDWLDLQLEQDLRDRGVREVTKSEKHDAILRIITEHAGEVADQIESARQP